MQVIISPTYSDIFEEPAPKLEEILKDIPSKVTITLLSYINAHLYLSQGVEKQIFLMKFLTNQQSPIVKNRIYNKTIKILENINSEPTQFFSFLYSMEFIHYELLNYRDFDIIDTTAQQELNFLKAYFIIAENLNNEYTASYNNHVNLDINYFQKTVWPTFTNQFEANNRFNLFTWMIKGLVLFNYLGNNLNYKKYVDNFLKINNKDKSWNYILDLMNLLKQNWDLMNQQKENEPISLYKLKDVKEFKSLFDNFTIDVKEYINQYVKSKKGFTGLKDKPLLKIEADNYIVTNWNFIANKLYDGLVFDFYNYSGINVEFDSILSFKKMIAENIIENFLFRKIIQKWFQKKHVTLLFDDNQMAGMPDAYIRERQHIYLFEIKDAFFPADAIDSIAYVDIKNAIDLKYNNNKKGTGQLIKQIEKLKTTLFEEKTYDELKLKPRNVIIYPIIIYTDKYFSIPGFNYYLKSEFQDKINEKNLTKYFKVIKDVTFINLSFLIDHVNAFGKDGLKLDEMINEYHNQISKNEKKFNKERNFRNLNYINDNFERVMYQKYKTKLKKSVDYVRIANEVFDLSVGLD